MTAVVIVGLVLLIVLLADREPRRGGGREHPRRMPPTGQRRGPASSRVHLASVSDEYGMVHIPIREIREMIEDLDDAE